MRIRKGVLVIVIILAFLSGYVFEASAKTFPVGAFFAMTGPQAYYGRVMSRGALTAIDHLNSAGGVEGYNFDLIISDFKNVDTNLTVTGVRKMISIDKTPVILASFSPTSLAAQPIAQKAHVLLLNGGAYSPQLIDKPYLYTTRPTQDEILPPMLNYFWKTGIRKLALIYVSDPSGELPAKNVVIPTWKKMGGTIVADEPHQPGLTDYGAYLARIKAKSPDAVIDLSTGHDIAYIIKGAREMGLMCPISITNWTPDNQAITGNASDNVFNCVEFFDRESKDPGTQRFIKDYEAKWSEPTDNYSANYYDAVYNVIPELIRRVMKKDGNPLSGEELEKAIWLNPSFNSVFGGKMTIKRNGTVKKPIVIFKITNGKMNMIEKVAVD